MLGKLICSICSPVGVARAFCRLSLVRQEVEADVPHALQVHLGLAWHTKLSYLVGIGMRNALAQVPKPMYVESLAGFSIGNEKEGNGNGKVPLTKALGMVPATCVCMCLCVCGAYLLNHLRRVPLAQVT